MVQREEDPQGFREGARGLRRPAATSSSPAFPTTSSTTIRTRGGDGPPTAPAAARPPRQRRPPAPPPRPRRCRRRLDAEPPGTPVVDVTMRIEEGKQYFVNRITFVGNTTTRDNVIRREMRLYEDGVFNTEALKYSVKRLNQLGYFKPLEGARRSTSRRRRTREQGRRQAEARGAEPQPAHLRRRRLAVRRLLRPAVVPDVELPRPRREPSRCRSQQGIARPELSARLHRAVPVRSQHHRRRQRLRAGNPATSASSRRSPPAVLDRLGLPARPLHAHVRQLQLRARQGQRDQPASTTRSGPSWHATRSCRLAAARRRAASASSARSSRASSTTRSTIRSSRRPASVTAPRSTSPASAATPTSTSRARRRLVLQAEQAASRSACAPRSSTSTRSAARGPADFREAVPRRRVQRPRLRHPHHRPAGSDTGLVLGGNKSLLFNVEELITIAGPVRADPVLRRRPGARRGESFVWKEPVKQLTRLGALTADAASSRHGRRLQSRCRRGSTRWQTSAFKTSTGAEIRFFMPVLNVPFRLIFAMNPQRGGVLDNNLQPEKRFKFRFAVGTTF